MSVFLITGGAGFIGSNYCEIMTNKYPKDKFICLDSLTYASNIDNLKNVNKSNFEFVKGSICDKNLVSKLFEKFHFDYVINFAAESHVDNSISNPTLFYETNVIGTLNLLEVSRKFGIKRFHQISTDEVYGDLPLESAEKFYETSLLKPSSPYSSSKASADLLVLSYVRTFGLDCTISRSSNNYGKYQNEEKLIPTFISKAIHNEPLPLYGTGKNIRDWIYVDDNCLAIDKIVRCGKKGEIYNISCSCEKSNEEIASIINNLLHRNEKAVCYVEDRKGHDLKYSMDSSKLKKELSWYPITYFDEGIKKTIAYYKER